LPRHLLVFRNFAVTGLYLNQIYCGNRLKKISLFFINSLCDYVNRLSWLLISFMAVAYVVLLYHFILFQYEVQFEILPAAVAASLCKATNALMAMMAYKSTS